MKRYGRQHFLQILDANGTLETACAGSGKRPLSFLKRSLKTAVAFSSGATQLFVGK
jgi:hypothetical protein